MSGGRLPPRGLREHALCQCCGCGFTRKVADRRRGWAKCCSKSCSAKLREAKVRGVKPDPGEYFDAPAGPEFGTGPEFDFHPTDEDC